MIKNLLYFTGIFLLSTFAGSLETLAEGHEAAEAVLRVLKNF